MIDLDRPVAEVTAALERVRPPRDAAERKALRAGERSTLKALDLQNMLAAERAGKARKGVLSVVEDILEKTTQWDARNEASRQRAIADKERRAFSEKKFAPGEETPTGALTFTNTTANTTIHLGDGRKLAPGESAEVTAELLRALELGE